jgi:hypothetical protein
MSRVEIPPATITAREGDAADEWKAAFVVPNPTLSIDPAGKTATVTTISQQSFTGILDGKLRAFTSLEGHMQGIAIEDKMRGTTDTIGNADLLVDLKEKAPGLRSGPVRLALSNIHVTGANGADETVGRLTLDLDIFGAGEKSSAPPTVKQRLMGLLSSYFGGGADSRSGFDLGVSAANIAVRTAQGRNVAISGAHLHTGVSNIKDSTADVALGLDYNGLSLAPALAGTGTLVPDHFRLALDMHKLPVDKIADAARGAGPAGLRSPLGAAMIAAQLPALLAEAGSTLSLAGTGFGNVHYNAALDGLFTAVPASPLHAVGKAHAEVTGFPYIIDTLTEAANAPSLPPPARARAQQHLSGLTVLQMVGQQKGDARVYDIELTPEGKALLNGTDMSVLFGAAKARKP